MISTSLLPLILAAILTLGTWCFGRWLSKFLKMDSHRSSASKSIIWRFMGVFVLGGVTYFFTRHWMITTAITLVHHATFILVFYLHERAWLRIPKPRGRARNVAKALVYEIILGMGIGGLIVLIFTGQWARVSQITLTYTAIKLVMYYLFDRTWK